MIRPSAQCLIEVWICSGLAELRRLLWHCRHLPFIAPDMDVYGKMAIINWTASGGGFVLCVCIRLPAALERIAAAPWSPPCDFADFPLCWKTRCKHGRWGLSELQGTGWLYSHLRGRLYQLGRLQFRLETYQHPWRLPEPD